VTKYAFFIMIALVSLCPTSARTLKYVMVRSWDRLDGYFVEFFKTAKSEQEPFEEVKLIQNKLEFEASNTNLNKIFVAQIKESSAYLFEGSYCDLKDKLVYRTNIVAPVLDGKRTFSIEPPNEKFEGIKFSREDPRRASFVVFEEGKNPNVLKFIEYNGDTPRKEEDYSFLGFKIEEVDDTLFPPLRGRYLDDYNKGQSEEFKKAWKTLESAAAKAGYTIFREGN
jgi:hypothetical protein